MARRSFPEAYLGGAPEFRGLQGSERWEAEYRSSLAQHEQALAMWLDPQQPETFSRLAGQARTRLDLALLYAWKGAEEQAFAQMRASASTIIRYIEGMWPDLSPSDTCDLALEGAMAAALVDRHDLAPTLFTYAERFAAGLVTGQEEHPSHTWISPAPFIGDSLVQVYSLLRLQRLSGFRAMLYPVPFPEARRIERVWTPATVEDLLATIDTTIAVARSRRDPMDLWHSRKYLIPVLHTLLASLRAPTSEAARDAAQQSLAKYYGMIRNLADFPAIYLRVLDLQKAFPHIYKPVAPSVF